MTSKVVLLSIVVCVLLFSCQQSESTDNNTPTETLINTSVFPVQPMQLDSAASIMGLRLSYTGSTVTDSSVFYQVNASYKDETFGFNLSVPKGEEGTAYLSGTGKVSDNLLHFMQGIYGRPADSSKRFAADLSAHFLSLGALVSDSTNQSHGKQGKLIFRVAGTGDSAELYLNINEQEHWIGLLEKDTVYRARLIKALTRQ